MKAKLGLSSVILLVLPPLLWAGNAVVGRMVHASISPMSLNFLRWLLAGLILLPLGYSALRRSSPVWPQWRRFLLLGLLGVGVYNSLQYLALQTSTPINVTLVAASMPVWMMLVGRFGFQAAVSLKQILGAVVSMVGVLVVLSHGELAQLLALRLALGDVLMLAATLAWSVYSWLLTRGDDADLRRDWAGYLFAQIALGLIWSSLFTATEWGLQLGHVDGGSWLWLAVAYVAIGPSLLAYRCWGLGVQRVGPNVAALFNNLTPLFAALLSTLLLSESPQAYHGLAFVLILGGILIAMRR